MEWAQELVSVVQNSEGIVRIKVIECIEEIFRHNQSQSDNKYEELQNSLVKMWLNENNWTTPAFSSLVRTLISCNSESGSY
jgi:hypothetical protein